MITPLITHFVALLMFFFAEFSISAILPIYITEHLQYDAFYSGYVVGCFSITAIFAKFCGGALTDRWGQKRIYILSIITTGIISFNYGFINTIGTLLVIRLMQGASSGIFRIVYQPITGALVNKNNLGKALGFAGVIMVCCQMSAAPIAIRFTDTFSFKTLFVILIMFYIVSFITASFIKLPKQPTTHMRMSIDSFLERKILPLASLRFISSASYGLFLAYGIIYARQFATFNSGYVLTAFGLASLFSRLLAGYIADKTTHYIQFLLLAYVVSGAGYLIFIRPEAILVGAFIIGLGTGFEYTTIFTAAFKKVDTNSHNRVSSTLEFTFSLGIGISTIMCSFFYIGTLNTLFLIMAGSHIVTIFLVIILAYIKKL